MSLTESPRAYEREADATRARLSSSLDQLANSLTPGRLLDEVLTYAKGGGGQFLKGLANATSANPIPSLLIGAGTALFLSGKGKWPSSTPASGSAYRPEAGTSREERAPSSLSRTARAATATVGDAMDTAIRGVSGSLESGASAVGEGASAAASAIGDTVSGGAGKVADAAGYVGTAAASAGRSVAEGVSSAIDAAAEAGAAFGGSAMAEADHLRDQSRRLAHDARDAMTRLAREQPLVVAATGLAVGVAIAALLPRSRLEDRWLGETSDAVKETVASVATEQYAKAKDAAGRVVEEVKDAAAAQGLTPSAAAETVRDLGDRLKTVVGAAGEGTSAESGHK
jgi:hypothetical protein